MGQTYASTYSFCMQFLDVTRHLASTGSERELPSRNSNYRNSFRQQAKVLHTHSASKNDVTCAGEKALVVLYKRNSTDSLDSLRQQRFCEKSHRARLICSSTSATTNIRSSNVPQSSCMCTCKSKNGIKESTGGLRPTEWGWQQCDMGFVPLYRQNLLPKTCSK